MELLGPPVVRLLLLPVPLVLVVPADLPVDGVVELVQSLAGQNHRHCPTDLQCLFYWVWGCGGGWVRP